MNSAGKNLRYNKDKWNYSYNSGPHGLQNRDNEYQDKEKGSEADVKGDENSIMKKGESKV